MVTEGIAIGQTIMASSDEHSANPGPWFRKPTVNVCLRVNSGRLLELFESTMIR